MFVYKSLFVVVRPYDVFVKMISFKLVPEYEFVQTCVCVCVYKR